MKILHCLNQYMPQAMGGTEIYVQTLATFQKRDGHEVAVVTPHIEYYRPGQIKEHYVYDGIDVYQYLEKTNPTNRQIHYGKKKPEGLNTFISLINTLKPGIIHFHELNRSIGFTLEHIKLARQPGVKVFVTMHLPFYSCNTNVLIYNNELCDGIIRNFRCTVCSYKTLFNVSPVLAGPLAHLSIIGDETSITGKMPAGKIRSLLAVPSTISRIRDELGELYNNVDQLVSLNKWYKEILIKNGVPEYKISVVPQALVTNTPAVKITEIPLRTDAVIKMIFLGRILPLKGIHLIIEAMRSFSAKQVIIDIYGRQDDTDYCKKCVRDSVNINSIRWKGELKREEVINTLSQYDIFCLPSVSSEMSPLVIQEAFAAGLPVLASEIYGTLEQVQHGQNGLLFKFNSAASLKKQIQMLVDNSLLITKMKNNIIPPKSFAVINEAYMQIYSS